jgi:hypothetical protein
MDAQDRIIWAQTGKGTRIGTAFDRIPAVKAAGSLRAWYAQQAQMIGFEFHRDALGTVLPEINHGRWIVRCSICGGAEEVAPEEPFFYCLSCGNCNNDGHPMQVVFPKNRETIENLLLIRQMENRNYLHNESVGDLLKENRDHGLDNARD